MVKMTKKMLAVALMASSVLVLAGCNKTPSEPEVVITPDMEEIMVDGEATSGLEVNEEAMPVENEATGAKEDTVVEVEQPVEIVVAE